MVDSLTYNMLHTYKTFGSDIARDESDPNIIHGNLDDDFIFRLPPRIQGFHMQDKKWCTQAFNQ